MSFGLLSQVQDLFSEELVFRMCAKAKKIYMTSSAVCPNRTSVWRMHTSLLGPSNGAADERLKGASRAGGGGARL